MKFNKSSRKVLLCVYVTLLYVFIPVLLRYCKTEENNVFELSHVSCTHTEWERVGGSSTEQCGFPVRQTKELLQTSSNGKQFQAAGYSVNFHY